MRGPRPLWHARTKAGTGSYRARTAEHGSTRGWREGREGVNVTSFWNLGMSIPIAAWFLFFLYFLLFPYITYIELGYVVYMHAERSFGLLSRTSQDAMHCTPSCLTQQFRGGPVCAANTQPTYKRTQPVLHRAEKYLEPQLLTN